MNSPRNALAERYLVRVDKIITQRDDLGVIFAATDIESGEKLQVFPAMDVLMDIPTAGETWSVHGNVEQNGKFGYAIKKPKLCYRTLPKGEAIINFLVDKVPGIGTERARALWDHFQLELGSILSDKEKIAEIAAIVEPKRPRLALRIAAAAIATWRDAKDEVRLVEWFTRNGLPDGRIVSRVAKILGSEAVDQLTSNPWILVPMMAWSKVDALGLAILKEDKSIKDPHSDLRRLVGAVDAAAKAALADGITAFDDVWLRQRISKLLEVRETSDRIQEAIAAGKRNGALILTEDWTWRVPGAALMEDEVSARLQSMTRPDYPGCNITNRAKVDQILGLLHDPSRPLHAEQKESVQRILQRPLAVLQGGAGVGKTYTMRVVCDVYSKLGWDVIPCALAGKAALRLCQSTGRPSLTLARLIGQLREREAAEHDLGKDTNDYLAEKTLERFAVITERTVIVVDEASMVDLATAYSLLKYMPPGSRILFVGDEAQLPPVSFGLLYHILVKDPSITTHLTHVHRQTKESGIPAISAILRRNEVPKLKEYSGKYSGVSFAPCEEEDMLDRIEEIVLDLGGHRGGVLVVSPTNDAGPASVDKVNERLHTHHLANVSSKQMRGFYNTWYAQGEPVICTANDYKRQLFNGLLGRIETINEDEGGATFMHVLFEDCIDPHVLMLKDLYDLALAHSITCHRAQGSQAPKVIIPLYKTRVMDPSWIYTAVTRAQEQVVLVGDLAVLKEALDRPRISESRTVGLKWLIKTPGLPDGIRDVPLDSTRITLPLMQRQM